MTHDAATAYACVAYRVMEYDGVSLSEEQFEVILEMLFGFYSMGMHSISRKKQYGGIKHDTEWRK